MTETSAPGNGAMKVQETFTSAGPRQRLNPLAFVRASPLSTGQLAVVRLLWGVIIGLALLLFLAALPFRHEELTSQALDAQRSYLQLDPRGGLLTRLFQPGTYAFGVLFLEVTFVLALVSVAAAIAWGRTDDWRMLFFSAVFIAYAVWVTPTLDAVDFPDGWRIVSSAMQATGQLLAVLFFLLFPDGRFVPAWTRISAAIWSSYCLAWAVFPHAWFSLVDPFSASVPAFLALMLGGWGVGLVAQAVRYRRDADETQRRQTKVVILVVAAACFGYSAIYLPGVLLPRSGMLRLLYDLFGVPIFWILALPMPVALTVAMLRHRLFNVSVVINKTVVYGVLGAFITAVYVSIVVGIGSLVSTGGEPNLGLSILATAVVAVAFQPVRERVQRFANRLVYGERATPYEVLSDFSHRMAGTYAAEDLLPRMARVLAEGIGASRAEVWLRTEVELRLAAAWPPEERLEEGTLPLEEGGHELPSLPGVSRAVPVRHHGELLGALAVAKAPGEPLTPTEDHLISGLASQAGLVLRNVRLTQELVARLKELQASRKRLVAAQDEERRKLERDIHDGAQQQLVALGIKLRLARMLATKDPPKAEEMLGQVEQETIQALENLRDLARGIYPPLLADRGLEAALSAQARKSPVPTIVETDGMGRYPQEAEAAVYFCCLEALQNVCKYAGAATARISLEERDGEVVFSLTDDGRGFDPDATSRGSGLQNMADRLAAIGGSVEVHSRPGHGTTVIGRVPVRALEPVG